MHAEGRPGCYIREIGTAVPEQSLELDEAVERLRVACINHRSVRLLPRLIRLAGVEKRYLAALKYQVDGEEDRIYRPSSEQPRGPGMERRTEMFDELSGPLVLRALATFPPDRLAHMDALVTVSCTHASSPGLEQSVLLHTPVPRTADRWNLGFMGCSGALAAMRLIHQTAPRGREALIVACELSSLHFQYTDQLDQMTANLLFADGAAAAALTACPTAVRVVDCRSITLPESADQMVWFAGNHGLKLRLSQALSDTLGACLPAIVTRFLRDNHMDVDAIDHWLVHPGGPQILDCVRDALRLPENALQGSRSVLRRYGNMSSPTILFIMKELFDAGADGNAVALAFGPGLTVEIVLLEMDRGRRPAR